MALASLLHIKTVNTHLPKKQCSYTLGLDLLDTEFMFILLTNMKSKGSKGKQKKEVNNEKILNYS